MTALALFTLLTLLLVVAAAGAVLWVLVERDGYGSRPAPRSQPDWSADGLPSRPWASRTA